jgi:hypothetical protein
MMQEDSVEKIEYLSYEKLPQPVPESISQGSINMGFMSKEWFIQFQTLSNLLATQLIFAKPIAITLQSSSTNCFHSITNRYSSRSTTSEATTPRKP